MKGTESRTIGSPEGFVDISKGEGVKAGNKANRGVREKSPSLGSVGQLLHALYTGSFKRTALKKAELTAMRSAPVLDSAQRAELLSMTSADRALDRTRRLMVLGASLDASSVRGQLMDFACEVLRRHPAFRVTSLTSALENQPDGPTEEEAIRALASQAFSDLPWSEGEEQLKKTEARRCHENAVHCLLLWFGVTRSLSLERILRHLQTNLWTHAARRCTTDAARLTALIATRDPIAVSVASSLLERRVLESSQRADSACKREDRAVAKAVQLKKQLEVVEGELSGVKDEVSRLHAELTQTRQAHENERAHWKDDQAQLRGQVLNRLKEELRLLEEGLHALRRDPPKIHVMLDHAERAIDGLKREMERVRGGMR